MRGNPRTVRARHESRPLWQRLLIALTLIAFAQSGYVTQTHIHPPVLVGSHAGEVSRGKAPARDDPQHCPFCQEFLLAGACLLPPPVVLPLPIVVAVQDFIASHQRLSFVRFALGWQSRAPPRI